MRRLDLNRVRRTVEDNTWAGSTVLAAVPTVVGAAALTALEFPTLDAFQMSGSFGAAFGTVSFIAATALNGSRSFDQ